MIRFGHRGAAGVGPGNTISSFIKALESSLDYIEMDVSVCKSGEVIVFHDTKLGNDTDGTGFVSDKTLSELQMLHIGKNEKLSTFQEVLDIIDKKTKVNVELKGDNSARAVYKIIEQYVSKKGWTYDHFLISSFDHYQLKEFYALNPKIKLGAVVAGIPIGYAEGAVKVHAYSIHLSKEFITKDFVDDAHNRGLKVYVYTINDAEFFEKIREFGVDGFFTDYPDRIGRGVC